MRAKNIKYCIFYIIMLIAGGCGMIATKAKLIFLEPINIDNMNNVELVIEKRRSIRSYKDEPILLNELSRLLWGAQGITDERRGFRAAPSAGALYPLEIYIVAGNIQGLAAGVYKYIIEKNALEKISDGDKRKELGEAAYSQMWAATAPASIVICGVYERTRRKYRENADPYVHMEVGAVAENIYLQGRSLNIGTCFMAGFVEKRVHDIISSKADEIPLAILPVGRIK